MPSRLSHWLILIVLLTIIALLLTWLDLPIATWIYAETEFKNSYLLNAIFRWAPIPSLLLSVSLLIALLIPKFKVWRRIIVVILLTNLLGSGLIIHAVLKEHWGRPRPKQLEVFGGKKPYYPFYVPAHIYEEGRIRSFPSGHASTGFFFLALYVVGRRTNIIWLKRTGLSLGIGLGIVFGLGRMFQGAHFATDIFFSGVIMWATAECLSALILSRQSKNDLDGEALQESSPTQAQNPLSSRRACQR